jgi:hypothetical protein
MKENKAPFLGTLGEAGTLVRRTFLKILLVFSGGTALSTSAAPAQVAATSGIKEEELAPFKKIANEKGVKLTVVTGNKEPVGRQTQMHLDMDMVRASLRNAIARAKQQGFTSLQGKLERLLANGTAAQQVDFVLGSGNRYYFPEDVEKLAAMAEKNKIHTFGIRCRIFCWISCWCTGDYTQECREKCREICEAS